MRAALAAFTGFTGTFYCCKTIIYENGFLFDSNQISGLLWSKTENNSAIALVELLNWSKRFREYFLCNFTIQTCNQTNPTKSTNLTKAAILRDFLELQKISSGCGLENSNNYEVDMLRRSRY